MRIKSISLFLVLMFCFSLAACGDSEVKRPVDYPDSKWTCNAANITFSVSSDGKITDATMVDVNGETISISLVFSDMEEGKVSVTNAEGTETYFSGNCEYGKKMFSITVTDIYSANVNPTLVRLTFNRS